MAVVYFVTLGVIAALYWFIDRRLSFFNIAVFAWAWLAMSGLIVSKTQYMYWLLVNYLIIFWLLLYLSGYDLGRLGFIETGILLIAWYVNVPDILAPHAVTRAQVLEIKQNYEIELFVLCLALLFQEELKILPKLLIGGHAVLYGVTTLPFVGFSGYLSISWRYQQYLAIAYNGWWIASAFIFYLYRRRGRGQSILGS